MALVNSRKHIAVLLSSKAERRALDVREDVQHVPFFVYFFVCYRWKGPLCGFFVLRLLDRMPFDRFRFLVVYWHLNIETPPEQRVVVLVV